MRIPEPGVAIQRLTALAEGLEREPHMLDDILPDGIDPVLIIDRACEVIAELRRQK